jgi:hypothetical protein
MPTIAGANAATKQELRDVASMTIFATFVSNDATPSVAAGGTFKTNNTAPTTITNFDGGYDGQRITVVANDNNTTLDFSASNLIGNNGNDLKLSSGDSFQAVRDNTGNWYVLVAKGIQEPGTQTDSPLTWSGTEWTENTSISIGTNTVSSTGTFLKLGNTTDSDALWLNDTLLFPAVSGAISLGGSSNRFNSLLITAGSISSGADGLEITSLEADSASAIAAIIKTNSTYTTAGANLLQVKNLNSLKFNVDKDGNTTAYGTLEAIGAVDGASFNSVELSNFPAGDILIGDGSASTELSIKDGILTLLEAGVEQFRVQKVYSDNTGAGSITTLNLPLAVEGMEYIVRRVASFAYRINPQTAEKFAGSTAGKYKSLDSDGAYMKIECLSPGIWHVMASFGTISDE